jgi:hypothetical protein
MKAKERERVWGELGGVLPLQALEDCFPIVKREIDRAVRRARREERKRLMTCECGRVCTGPVQ